MTGGSRRITFLTGLTIAVVVVALGATIAFTYVQIRAELNSLTLQAVENHLRSQHQILVRNLRMIAEGQKSLLSFMVENDDVNATELRRFQRSFAWEHTSVRSSMVLTGDREPSIAPDHFAEELRETFLVDELDRTGTEFAVHPTGFQDAGGWYLGNAFPDSFGLRSMLPIAVFDFAGVRQTTGMVAAVDVSHMLYELRSNFSIVIDNRQWELDIALYDRDGMLLATTRNHLRQRHPILSSETAAKRDIRGENSPAVRLDSDSLVVYGENRITEVVQDQATGLYLAGSVPAPAITRRVAFLSSQIVIIGVVGILAISVLGLILVRTVRRLATVEKQRADMHARSVQSILGPHFLFNSLDAIVGLVSQKNYEALMRTLKALTIQLEGAVRNFETEVTVAQELEYVSSYLEIQSRRYRGYFSVDMRVSPDVRFETIPRFCIQPVVENCFTHAIPYSTETVSILISVTDYDANTVAVVVSDSGPGMNQEDRMALLEAFANDENPERHGIGLYTVHSRLTTAFGKKFGIRIVDSESEVSDFGIDEIYSGMSVVVLLPKTR